jgi:hypothetical protein
MLCVRFDTPNHDSKSVVVILETLKFSAFKYYGIQWLVFFHSPDFDTELLEKVLRAFGFVNVCVMDPEKAD